MPAENLQIKGFDVDLSQLWGADSDGSEQNPYRISSVDAWVLLGDEVAGGKTFSGKYFKMGADIGPVTTTVGAAGTPFSGHFDGDGHTLSLDISQENVEYLAPFHCISGATIANLIVTGSILGNKISTAGLVGQMSGGENTIADCAVSVTITSNMPSTNSTGGYLGGIAGSLTGGTVHFLRCVFDGSILKYKNNTAGTHHGCILGSVDSNVPRNSVACTQCFVHPDTITPYYNGSMVGIDGTFTITDCFYTPPVNGSDYALKKGTKVEVPDIPEGMTVVRNDGVKIGCGLGTLYADGVSWKGVEYYTPGSFVLEDLTACDGVLCGQSRYWTTFFHPSKSYALPAGARAFIMKSDHVLYRLGDGSLIPAGCPVVIMSESESVKIAETTAAAAPVEGNVLLGTSEQTEVSSLGLPSEKNAYVLGKVRGVFGFCVYTDSIPANKVYYVE